MASFGRYLLFQVPGWMIVAGVSAGLHEWGAISAPVAAAFVGLVVGLDFVLYPFVRHGYEPGRHVGVEALIGESAVVYSRRYAKLRGELWRFRPAEDEEPFQPGDRGRVVGASGLTLVLARAPTLE